MDPEARYEQLTDDLIKLYEQGRQRDALELLHAADPDLAPLSGARSHVGGAPAIRELPAEAKESLSQILIGTADDLLEVVEGTAEQLSTLGLEIERMPGIGHEFPQGFSNWLGTVLPNCG